ncbi:MAG: DUF1003 domain-containing protein [Candidatus Magasanikbacteria bacterium]|nr:DUF1003 domain-containing protein [Candidatus Magasanikbacteria bacterium]
MKPTQNTTPDQHPITAHHQNLTFGQRASDYMSTFMGSWTFLFAFAGILLIWIAVNVYAYWMQWDPYPFILLNLVLSCLASVQAPIIMMSENRQAQRDRMAAQYDHAVNRKAEREIQNMQKDLEEIKTLIKNLK